MWSESLWQCSDGYRHGTQAASGTGHDSIVTSNVSLKYRNLDMDANICRNASDNQRHVGPLAVNENLHGLPVARGSDVALSRLGPSRPGQLERRFHDVILNEYPGGRGPVASDKTLCRWRHWHSLRLTSRGFAGGPNTTPTCPLLRMAGKFPQLHSQS